MLVVSDVEVWHIVQESDNVAVIYLTQEFWVRLDLVNSQIITSQHSPTWQDSNSHCRENRLFQSADGKESRWSKYSWGALQYRDWVSRQRISSQGFSVPQGQRIPTLSTPSRAAQVPETAAKDKWGRKQISSSCYTACWCWAAHCLTHDLCMGECTHLSNTYIFINDISLHTLQKKSWYVLGWIDQTLQTPLPRTVSPPEANFMHTWTSVCCPAWIQLCTTKFMLTRKSPVLPEIIDFTL